MQARTSPEQLLGVDLGGTKTALIAGDASGAVLGRVEFATRPEDGYLQWLARLRSAYGNLQAVAGEWRAERGGVSCGGPADWSAGRLKSPPNLPGWTGAPLRQDLADVTGLPFRMEHDGRAGALAEAHFGAGQGCSDLIFLTFGTGIGAGIISGGRLIRGAGGSAGEIGHVRLTEDGPEAYGKRGCVESFASGTGIARLAVRRFPERFGAETSAKRVIELARSGDPDAGAVLRESARRLGEAMAILADLFNPQIIVLGSLARRVPEWYLEMAVDVMRAEALPETSEACRVVPSGLGERLQDVAALCAAMEGVGPA